MKIIEVVPLISILWRVGIARSQSGVEVYEQFSCYRCEQPAGESCNTIDRTCSYPLCAKIKYKDDDNVIKVIRECSPSEQAVAGDICSQAEQLRGKPCDAWLCDTPMCNSATSVLSATLSATSLLSAIFSLFRSQTLLLIILPLYQLLIYCG